MATTATPATPSKPPTRPKRLTSAKAKERADAANIVFLEATERELEDHNKEKKAAQAAVRAAQVVARAAEDRAAEAAANAAVLQRRLNGTTATPAPAIVAPVAPVTAPTTTATTPVVAPVVTPAPTAPAVVAPVVAPTTPTTPATTPVVAPVADPATSPVMVTNHSGNFITNSFGSMTAKMHTWRFFEWLLAVIVAIIGFAIARGTGESITHGLWIWAATGLSLIWIVAITAFGFYVGSLIGNFIDGKMSGSTAE